MPGITERRAMRRGQKRRGDYSSKGSDASNPIKRQTSFPDPKVTRNNFRVKDQGTVPYPKVERVANGGPPKPGMGKGKSRGGGAAIRGTKFEGVF